MCLQDQIAPVERRGLTGLGVELHRREKEMVS